MTAVYHTCLIGVAGAARCQPAWDRAVSWRRGIAAFDLATDTLAGRMTTPHRADRTLRTGTTGKVDDLDVVIDHFQVRAVGFDPVDEVIKQILGVTSTG
jgi:hypothetical protein